MLLALAAVAAANWVPMRWHSSEPRSLELLAGTPVNCLLVERGEWNRPFVDFAHRLKLAVLGVVRGGADVTAARELSFDALVLEGEYAPELAQSARGSAIPVIELPPRARIPLESRDPIIGTSQALWPGVEAEHGGRTVLGPTSTPWINTNAGFLRFLRGSTDAAIWVAVRPPPGTIFPPDRYARVIGDAALVGARWVVSLDDDLDRRVLARDPAALNDWRQVAGYLAYYETHAEWRSYRPFSRLAVIQSAADGGLLSGSLLDMLSSQRSSVRAIPPERFRASDLADARVVLDVDPDRLSAGQRQSIEDFERRGGVVVNPPGRWKFPPATERQMILDRKQAAQLQSLWEVAYGATVRKNFGARTFNTAGVLSNVLVSPEGRSTLVHLLNFLDFAGEDINVQVLGKWRRARLYRVGQPPIDLPVYPVADGTGVDIDSVPLMATLLFEQ